MKIEQNGVVEEYSILRNNGDVFSEAIKFQVCNILVVNKNSSFFWSIDSKEQIKQRRFTKSTWANDGIGCTRYDFKTEIFQQLLFLKVEFWFSVFLRLFIFLFSFRF